MTVVLDSNALVQMSGLASPHAALKRALMEGRLVLAVSTPILLEYEEVICRYSSRARWEDVERMFALIRLLHGTIREIAPSFRFRTITGDADDDAFADRGGGARDKWRQGSGRAKRLWPMRTSSSPRIIISMPCVAVATSRSR